MYIYVYTHMIMNYDSQKQGKGHDGNGNNIDKHRCQVLTTAEGEVWTMKLPGKQHSWQTLALNHDSSH